MQERIGVVGLGYVGLPVALAFAKQFPDTVGFDINKDKIEALRCGQDRTGEVCRDALLASSLQFTSEPGDLKGCTFFVVAVPTGIDGHRRPDLGPLRSASRIVGSALSPGAV